MPAITVNEMQAVRNKTDLIIEKWEQLDCESVGERELIAIEEAVREKFGDAAVDSPIKIARLLADEGAELRHAEIMALYVARYSDRPYDAVFRNLISANDLRSALASIRRLENLRRKFVSDEDAEGVRLIREYGIRAKEDLQKPADAKSRDMRLEAAEWFTIWLQSPEIFENWIKLRRSSSEFTERFGSSESI